MKIRIPAGNAATSQASQPKPAFAESGKKFQPIRQKSPPVRNMNDIWLKPRKAASETAADPFERDSKPAAAEIVCVTGTVIAILALALGSSGVVSRPAAIRNNVQLV